MRLIPTYSIAAFLRRVAKRPAQNSRVIGAMALVIASLAMPMGIAQVEVRTLEFLDSDVGGVSEFDTPQSLAFDTDDVLFLAERGSGRVRRVDLVRERVSTVAINLPDPVGVAVDQNRNLYVATMGDGRVRRFDRFGNHRATIPGFLSPAALAVDAKTNILVAEKAGRIRAISNGTEISLVTTFPPLSGRPVDLRGVVSLDNGSLAVTDAGSHSIRVFNPATQMTTVLAGGPDAGFRNGTGDFARFNMPHQIAKGLNGSLVVADRLNHRVRLIECDGTVSTIYGIDSNQWVTLSAPGIFPGWEDGSADFAEAREPVGVAVSSAGDIFTTEAFYGLLRVATGLDVPVSTCGGGSGAVSVPLPVIQPRAGYFPMGVRIQVSSSSEFGGFGPDTRIYYTTDGSEPSTNSQPVAMEGAVGTIRWRDAAVDLSSLRVKAFNGTNSSSTVQGQAFGDLVADGEVGIPEGLDGGTFFGGAGSTLAIPVVANLRPGTAVRSLQFLVEVAPLGGAPPIEPPLQVRTVPMAESDFIPVIAASTNMPTTFSSRAAGVWKLAVAYVGTNVFGVEGFGTVAMLAVPVPPGALEGQQYTIEVSRITGTSDGVQQSANLAAMPARTIQVSNTPYLVGDTSPGFWYQAGSFGDGLLGNSDVNNAFFASLGFRVPYQFTDAFDAMDVFPEDIQGRPGGDEKIRFLDWQLILRRSLGLSDSNWWRSRAEGGGRVNFRGDVGFSGAALMPSSTAFETEIVWDRPVLLGAGRIDRVPLDASVEVPLYMKVKPGHAVAGFQFVAWITPEGEAPAVVQPAEFVLHENVPLPFSSGSLDLGGGPVVNAVYAAWDGLNPSNVPMTGSNSLGWIRFKVPAGALPGHRYVISFSTADGASAQQGDGSYLPYDFETMRGDVWIEVAATSAPERISDEWKNEFFAGVKDPQAQPHLDVDDDGFTNWQEYISGLDPRRGNWRYQLESGQFKVRWFGEAGVARKVKRSPNLQDWVEISEAIMGNDQLQVFTDEKLPGQTQFYQVIVVQ